MTHAAPDKHTHDIQPKIANLKYLPYLLALVQFVNILDFMIVMPLGPDLAKALGVIPSQLGLLGAAYTGAACITGFLGSFFFDRFERKRALIVAFTGLAISTVGAALSPNAAFLILARIVAGGFGGPTSSIMNAIIADAIPPAERGRAMSKVMASFSLASIFGVPFGLELAQRFSWHMPFVALGLICVPVLILIALYLPKMDGHMHRKNNESNAHWLREFSTKIYLYSFLSVGCALFSNFLIVPNLSTFFQGNLGYPRDSLGQLYLVGGVMTFLLMILSGKITDAKGAMPVVLLGSIMSMGTVALNILIAPPAFSVPIIFYAFMTGNGIRMVALNSLTSRVPHPQFRARFMALQSFVQHSSSSLGAFLSTLLLTSNDLGQLEGMQKLGVIFLVVAVSIPALTAAIARNIQRVEQHRALATHSIQDPLI